MRAFCLTLALLLAAPALAQDPEPDTTDWHHYLPLAVGNAWQYEYREGIVMRYASSLAVTGDSLVDGTTYFTVEHCTQVFTDVACGPVELIRYDEDTAAVVQRLVIGGDVQFELWPSGLSNYTFYCRFDLPFGLPAAECFDGSQPFLSVAGGYGVSVSIGGDPSPDGTYKSIYGGFGWVAFLSGVGLVETEYELDDVARLVYARLDGVEYGTAVVANEPGPTPEVEALAVYPNPLRDVATLRFWLDAPERLTLEVYDVRGRRLRTLALGSHGAGPHEVRFDAAALAPGAYRFRLTGSGGFDATRGVIVVR